MTRNERVLRKAPRVVEHAHVAVTNTTVLDIDLTSFFPSGPGSYSNGFNSPPASNAAICVYHIVTSLKEFKLLFHEYNCGQTDRKWLAVS